MSKIEKLKKALEIILKADNVELKPNGYTTILSSHIAAKMIVQRMIYLHKDNRRPYEYQMLRQRLGYIYNEIKKQK